MGELALIDLQRDSLGRQRCARASRRGRSGKGRIVAPVSEKRRSAKTKVSRPRSCARWMNMGLAAFGDTAGPQLLRRRGEASTQRRSEPRRSLISVVLGRLGSARSSARRLVGSSACPVVRLSGCPVGPLGTTGAPWPSIVAWQAPVFGMAPVPRGTPSAPREDGAA